MRDNTCITVQPGYKGRELLAIMSSDYDYYTGKPRNQDDVPVGTVEWVEQFLGGPVKPDYYPEYLKDMLHRKVWKSDTAISGMFVKPGDRYKRFDGQVFKMNCPSDVWCSEVVEFVDEWRYYVADGDILAAGWYSGSDENSPPPDIPVKLRGCGAYDFGRLKTGELALVEYQHPYACGWYGDSKDHALYVDWLVRGWESMQ